MNTCGVPVTSVNYFTGGEEQTGRPEKIALHLPPEFRVQPIGRTQTLSTMLDSGEIDALYTARMPSCFRNGSGRVRRLFEDYPTLEREYYLKTKIFPVMHTVAIRREVYEKNRWIAQALFKAFVLAQREAYEDLNETAALKFMLPWLPRHIEDTQKLMGEDFWPYGLEPNLHTLNTFHCDIRLRAGSFQAPAYAQGSVRSGDVRVVQVLAFLNSGSDTACMALRPALAQIFGLASRKASSASHADFSRVAGGRLPHPAAAWVAYTLPVLYLSRFFHRSICARVWFEKLLLMTKLGWPVAQPRFTRRPSASR